MTKINEVLASKKGSKTNKANLGSKKHNRTSQQPSSMSSVNTGSDIQHSI